jgi:hypothetical protein
VMSRVSLVSHKHPQVKTPAHQTDGSVDEHVEGSSALKRPSMGHRASHRHVGFAGEDPETRDQVATKDNSESNDGANAVAAVGMTPMDNFSGEFGYFQMSHNINPRVDNGMQHNRRKSLAHHALQDRIVPHGGVPPTPLMHNLNSPFYVDIERTQLGEQSGYFKEATNTPTMNHDGPQSVISAKPSTILPSRPSPPTRYTSHLKERPALTFVQQLKPYNGRLHYDNWLKVAARPFILYAYPAVLWSSIVYACSVGWLIVLSESVAVVYRTRTTYGFSALSTGLIYISPFVGGVLGTAVAGKVSDIIVRAMSKRNGGLYEPEFRLVMAIPISITTVIGLMGFGWSAQVHDAWIVPTLFFGIISFGCSLGSTTAITFCVDSYRQYAGEALVTLNFTKNIFHGLVFSLFFTNWLETDGSKKVFIWVGVIQLIVMAFTVPMYIFGKRARMWTVRKNLMEKF